MKRKTKSASLAQLLLLTSSLLAGAIAQARNDPPPVSEKTWAPPNLANYERELAAGEAGSRVSINPRKIYGLAELIDIAERNNPETRVAWERARQAAAAVGLSESAYYPFIVASAAAGYDRAFIPFPTLTANPANPSLSNVRVTGGGSLVTEAKVYRGELNAKWLLLDFGERSAVVASAREQLMMANVGFNGTHQKIVFQVTDRFYQLGTVRQKVLVARSSLEAAQQVEQAVQARIDNGLATQPELLQAQQQSAQTEFDVEAATGLESDARVALVESIGILPTVPLKVADLSQRSTSEGANGSVDELIERALWQRPDLVAKLANVHAKEDGVAKQVVEELRPFIEREKEEHIRRAVTMGKRGFERIGKLWDAEEPIDPKRENLAASSLDKHDEIIRRNLGMNDEEPCRGGVFGGLSVYAKQAVIGFQVRKQPE